MKRPRILLADDHVVFAQALVSYLSPSFEVIGIVGDGLELIEAAHKHSPDVIVADIGMPRKSGMDALRHLQAAGFKTKLIFLTMHTEPALAAEAIRAGAMGCVLKHSAGEELVDAINQVLRGNVYLSPRISGEIILALSSNQSVAVILSPRQREVLQLIVEGLTMKQVATALELSTRTVETHKYAMMQRLGVQSTAELVRYAVINGLVLN